MRTHSKIEIPNYWLNPFSLLGVPPRFDKEGKYLSTGNQEEMFKTILLDKVSDIIMGKERKIEIPKDVRKELEKWRPTPLERARGLEKRLNLPGNIMIYYKDESVSPSNTHKSNAAVPQAYYAVGEGLDAVYTVGQRGGNWFEAFFKAFSGKISCLRAYWVAGVGEERERQMHRIGEWQKKYDGVEVRLCPDEMTPAGVKALSEYQGKIVGKNVATAQAIEWMLDSSEKAKVIQGCSTIELFHTIIGEEASNQFSAEGTKPDIIIGCGAGSSTIGMAYPFIYDKWDSGGELNGLRVIAVEDKRCSPLSLPFPQNVPFEYTGNYLPQMLAYSLPEYNLSTKIKASGVSGRLSHEVGSWMRMRGFIEPYTISEETASGAQLTFEETEGITVYPETAYAVAGTIDLAQKYQRAKIPATILFCLTGGKK